MSRGVHLVKIPAELRLAIRVWHSMWAEPLQFADCGVAYFVSEAILPSQALLFAMLKELNFS